MQAFTFLDLTLYGEPDGRGGDTMTASFNLLLVVTGLVLFGTGFRRIKSVQTGAILALGLAGLLLCSAVWSVSPSATLREGTVYLFVIVGAIGIVCSIEPDRFMNLLARLCFFSGAASVLLYVVSPSIAMTEDGLRGIFIHKNILGSVMAIGVLATLHGLRARKGRSLSSAFFTIFMIIVALLSQSGTSCLTIFVYCGTEATIALIRKGGFVRLLGITLVCVALPLVLYGTVFSDSLLEIMGKDPTLTGRTEIWRFVIPDIFEKPWLGWGYLAFWVPDNPAAREISDSLLFDVPEAHNAVLELLLNVGLVGTAIVVLLFVRNIVLATRCLRTSQKTTATSTLLYSAGVIVVGVTEGVLLNPLEAATSIFFITGLFCEQAIWVEGWRRRQAHLQRLHTIPVPSEVCTQ